jgi:hypothetical protein
MMRRFGTHRTVYLIGSWAIKVPVFAEWRLFLHGLLANMQERNFGALGCPELCPVIFGMPGGWFIVMRRAEAVSFKRFVEIFPTRADFDKWVDTPDYHVPVELKPDSFGILDGKIVAVDYGS